MRPHSQGGLTGGVSSTMKARDVMARKVYTVRPDEPIVKAISVLCRHRISGVPVVDCARRLVGLISERDILHAMYPARAELAPKRNGGRRPPPLPNLARIRARDIMVQQVITASPDTDLLQLASLMAVRKIRRVPIVEGQRLVGIVSQGDVHRGIFSKRVVGRPAAGAEAAG